jgi:hypothetical protein
MLTITKARRKVINILRRGARNMMGFSAINLAAILTKIIPALIFLLKHTKHMR